MGKHSCTYKFSALVLGIAFAWGVIACESRGTDEASVYVPMSMSDTSFKAVSAAVLIPQCVKCHSEFNSESGLAAVVIAGDPAHSPLYQMISSGEMPKGGAHLSASQVEMVRLYIQNLKPGQNTGPVIDLNNVTWDILSQQVIGPRCVQCHANFATEQGFSDYVKPGDAANSIIYKEVSTGKMPLKSNALSQNNVEAISVFIKNLKPYPDPVIDLGHVTYDVLAKEVFGPRCILCHKGFSTEAGIGKDIEPGDPESSLLYNYVLKGKMPEGAQALEPDTAEAIAIYIKSLPPTIYPAPTASYKNLAVTLFQRSCVQCHSGKNPPKGLKLDNYSDIFVNNDTIMDRLTAQDKPMPPTHSTKAPDAAVIKAFTDWYNAGTPNN